MLSDKNQNNYWQCSYLAETLSRAQYPTLLIVIVSVKEKTDGDIFYHFLSTYGVFFSSEVVTFLSVIVRTLIKLPEKASS